jgi:hypothetical protein
MAFSKGYTPWNKGKPSQNRGKHWKIKDTSNMGHTAWNKGKGGYSTSKKGQKMSEEVKRKISLAKIGKPSWNKGLKGYRAGKGTRPNVMPKGEKHWKWIKDRTQLKDDHRNRGGQLHRDWSNRVKKRDGEKCKMHNFECSNNLVAHHIYSWAKYPELRYNIDNGITLCTFHHPKKRADEKQLIPFFIHLLKK